MSPAGTATSHGLDAYLPLPKEQREGVALCLSGGGYRAGIFHAGALTRLNELGILSKVDTFTSVSGGSVANAALATYWARLAQAPAPGEVLPGFEEGVARPLRRLARHNVRTGSVLSRLKPSMWFHPGASIEGLAERYASELSTLRFAQLPGRPSFVFCASDMRYGSQWVFDSGRREMGSERAGFEPIPSDLTLARATAASSCVPAVFSAVRLDGDWFSADRNGSRPAERGELTDGGMYDNLGVEPVWRDHKVVLVSDGAPTYAGMQNDRMGWKLARNLVILLDQSSEVRKRWIISSFVSRDMGGAYWGIASRPTSYEQQLEVPVYSDELVERFIARVRIDLDSFSEGEIGVLENHGYLMAELAVQRHAADMISGGAPPPSVPHPEWMGEDRARQALRRSHVITPLGRWH